MKIKFRVFLCVLISTLIVVCSSTTFFASEKYNTTSKQVLAKEINIDKAKEKVEDFISVNLRKYDTSSKSELSYDGIVKKNSDFYSYVKKMSELTNTRYKCFDTLRLEKIVYEIEYGNIVYNDGVYTINATVLEEKKYLSQDEPGYVCTEHVFTIEQNGDEFYILNDVTDDYVDEYLRNYADKENVTIDTLIKNDKKNIQESLNMNDSEFNAYLKEVNKHNSSKLVIYKVKDLDDNTSGVIKNNMSDMGSDDISVAQESGNENGEKHLSRGVKHYSFNYNKMYAYAACYNGASPYKISRRNPAYTNYDTLGGDCTNYISQILRAGGAPLDDTGSYQWYYYSDGNRSSSWTGVGNLYTYLVNNDYIGPQGYKITSDEAFVASEGDLIQLKLNGSSSFGHSLWIISHQTSTTSCTRIACHTSDRWNEPLDSMHGTRRWIKLTGYDK